MKEQHTQSKIIKYLESEGCYVVKIITASRSGVPDIIGCLPSGKFFAIEVKQGSNKASPLQKYNLDKIRKTGGIAFVANSVEKCVDIMFSNV